MLRSFTVWEFRSPSTGETATVVKHSECDDMKYQHEYQRIVWRGLASSKNAAMSLACMAKA